MKKEEEKHRGRLSSEAITATDSGLDYSNTPYHQKNISPTHKPLADPDEPPELSLESGLQPFVASEKEEEQAGNGKEKRSRTKSEDNQHTILGFMEKKIKVRLLSQQFENKASLEDHQK